MFIGLGASTLAGQQLSPAQIYATAKAAGFPPAVATQMTAIALRESKGWTGALYTGKTGGEEYSTGLWQINTKDSGVRSLLASNGITPDMLADPDVNAKAAYLLWGGNPKNLDVAWYINRPGYREAYEANLSTAEAAAASVEGSDPLAGTGDGYYTLTGGGGDGGGSGSDSDTDAATVWGPSVLAAVGLFLVLQTIDR